MTTRTCPVCGEQHEERHGGGLRYIQCSSLGAGCMVSSRVPVVVLPVGLRNALEDFARRLEWSACVLAPEAIDARSWARELRRVLGPTATTQPAPPAPGGPVVVEASGVEVVGTTKPGGDA